MFTTYPAQKAGVLEAFPPRFPIKASHRRREDGSAFRKNVLEQEHFKYFLKSRKENPVVIDDGDDFEMPVVEDMEVEKAAEVMAPLDNSAFSQPIADQQPQNNNAEQLESDPEMEQSINDILADLMKPMEQEAEAPISFSSGPSFADLMADDFMMDNTSMATTTSAPAPSFTASSSFEEFIMAQPTFNFSSSSNLYQF